MEIEAEHPVQWGCNYVGSDHTNCYYIYICIVCICNTGVQIDQTILKQDNNKKKKKKKKKKNYVTKEMDNLQGPMILKELRGIMEERESRRAMELVPNPQKGPNEAETERSNGGEDTLTYTAGDVIGPSDPPPQIDEHDKKQCPRQQHPIQ
ncbi:hypothetical protein RFI_13563, partial [Reticulomyxa filosa]